MTSSRPGGDPSRDLLGDTPETLYEEAPCGFLSAVPDGTLVRVNRWITERLGRPREALVGKVRLQELFAIGGRIYWETHVQPLLRMQGFVEEIALELVGFERSVPVLLNAVLHRDEEGEPLGLRATLLDVTERRRYERELVAARDAAEQAARAKGTLVSMVSHDLRNPLSAVVTATELLGRTSLDETQIRYLRVIERAARTMVTLLDDVLVLGRIDAGHARIEAKPFDMRGLIHELATEHGLVAERKGLELVIDISEEVAARVVGDSIKIGRVLSNLIGNAVKFTEQGRVVVSASVVRSDAQDVTLALEVRDTGIGIDQKQLARIFDDFAQGSAEIGARHGGSGLGLGICKRLLTLHGSELKVSSRPGQGSSFAFTLMLARAPDMEPDGGLT